MCLYTSLQTPTPWRMQLCQIEGRRCLAHVSAHVPTHAYTHVYVHVYTHVFTHVYTHVYKHVYRLVHTHTCRHVYAHLHTLVYTHACCHAYTRVCMHICAACLYTSVVQHCHTGATFSTGLVTTIAIFMTYHSSASQPPWLPYRPTLP